MRSQHAILILASLLVLAPATIANHPVAHVAVNETEPLLALTEMAVDGYVVSITRVGDRVFQVRVLHEQALTRVAGQEIGLQYAFDPVNVRGTDRVCPVNTACSNVGVWLHGLRVEPTTGTYTHPGQGIYPAQSHAYRVDLNGARYLEVTITEQFTPTFQGFANVVVQIENSQSNGWVRGLYNVAKLTVPLDALDAVGQVIRIA